MAFKVVVLNIIALPGAEQSDGGIEVNLSECCKYFRILGDPTDDHRPTIVVVAEKNAEEIIRAILADQTHNITPKDIFYIDRDLQRIRAVRSINVDICQIVPFGTPQIVGDDTSLKGMWQAYTPREAFEIAKAQQPVY